MKTMKKLLSLVLALAMCLSMAMTAFAAATVSDVQIDEKGKVKIIWSDGKDSVGEDATKDTKESKAPTCGEKGQDVWTVVVEGKTYRQVFDIPATKKHTYDTTETRVTKEPTCSAEGEAWDYQICSVCKKDTVVADSKKTLNKLPHTEKTVYSDVTGLKVDDKGNPVFGSDGKAILLDAKTPGSYKVKVTCTVCGDVIKNETVTVEATEKEAGVTVIEAVKNIDTEVKEIDGLKYTVAKKAADGKYALVSCDKPGTYRQVTYVKGSNTEVLLAEKEQTEPARHTPGNPTPVKTSSKYVEFSVKIDGAHAAWKTLDDIKTAVKDGKDVAYEYNTDGTLKARNTNCAKTESYDWEAYCTCDTVHTTPYKITGDTKVLDASTTHSYVTKTVSDTSTCTSDGTKTTEDVCVICGAVKPNSQATAAVTKADHIAARTTTKSKENEVPATAHNPGSFELVETCDICKQEVSRTKVVVPNTSTEYNWSYSIKWGTYDITDPLHPTFTEWRFEDTGRDDEKKNTLDVGAKPTAHVFARPTDDDLTDLQKDALITHVAAANVTEDTTKATKGDECHMATKVFTAKAANKYIAKSAVGAIVPDVSAKGVAVTDVTDTFEVKQASYKGHAYGLETRRVVKEATETENGEAVWEKTCSICNDVLVTRKEIIPATGKKADSDEPAESTKTDISGATIEGSEAYRGEYFNVAFTVELNGKTLLENVDFVITNPRKNNFKGVGPHTIKIAGIGDYEGEASGKVYITETSQDVFVTPTKKSITAKSLKKKSSSFTIKVDGAKGKVSFSSSSKKVTVNANGKVTVKKGTKKGTYKVTVKVAKNGGFKAVTKTVTITVK